MARIRLATVTEQQHPQYGQRFIVQQWLGTVVYCWGQCTSYRGSSTRHGTSLSFHQDSVTVADFTGCRRTLARELFAQASQDLRRRGALASHHANPIVSRRPYSEPFVALAAELGVDLQLASQAELAMVHELLEEGGDND